MLTDRPNRLNTNPSLGYEGRHLVSLDLWSRRLPEFAFTPGLPPAISGAYCVVRFTSGKRIAGRTSDFQEPWPRRLALNPKYGPSVDYVMAGD